MIRKVLLLYLSLFIILFVQLDNLLCKDSRIGSNIGKLNTSSFIENKGQWPEEVLYLTKTKGMRAWITKSGIVYDYYQIINDNNHQPGKEPYDKFHDPDETARIKGHVVKADLVNCLNSAKSVGKNKRATYYNYFIGNDSTKWASFVPLFGEVIITDIYKGIDIRYYYDNNMLRYDYIIHPGADIAQIKMNFEGQADLSIDEKGELVILTSLGEVKQGEVLAFQPDGSLHDIRLGITNTEVACSFRKNEDGSLGFALNEYDKGRILIIDPLVWSTFIGDTQGESGASLVLDVSNNIYITGGTGSTNFPTTSGAYDESYTGGTSDIFISKFNSNATTLLYSTFIGGDSYDAGAAITVDASNNVYITGNTMSSNYPTSSGAFDEEFNSVRDVIVSKISSNGANLLFSTFLGGNDQDAGYAIALDNSNNVYVTGKTPSDFFPTTTGAFDETFNNAVDVFVAKLNSSGTTLMYSTFIGGSNWEEGEAIVVDNMNNAYVTGYTGSNSFPTTAGAYNETINGTSDAFVCKINSSGSDLSYSTFLGGNLGDYGKGIAIDNLYNIYVSGYTESTNFTTTNGTYDESHNGSFDVFVTKFSSDLSSLLFSTFLGGENEDICYSISLSDSNYIFISGSSSSDDYPTTSNAYSENRFDGTDVIISCLHSDASSLIYSTYFGGTSSDFGRDIKVDESLNVYITGNTNSTDFPFTTGVYDESFNGDNDGYVAVLDIKPDSVKICDQTWLTRNLNVTQYRNGDPIPEITNATEWENATSGAWCYYNNDPANGAIYGKLYNWYAVNDPRGLAPEGWHIPTDDEWKEIEMCLGMSKAEVDSEGERGTDEGGSLKETGTIHWNSPNYGATNESGFTALPAGARNFNGDFYYLGSFTRWWTSSENGTTTAWIREIVNNNANITRVGNDKDFGFSVRCVKTGYRRRRDSLALVALYNATNGNNWTTSTNWLTTNPINTWHGIYLNANGRVRQIALNDNNLTGYIPSEIENLQELTNIRLDGNQIGDSIPSEIGNLSILSILRLENNNLNGSIPTTIGNLTELTELRLQQNDSLSGSIPTSIGNLTKLIYLYLYECNFSGSIPSTIGNLAEVTNLYMQDNQLSGTLPSEIGDLSKLQRFYFHTNNITGTIPTSFENLDALLDLRGQVNNLSGPLPTQIGGMASLQLLILSDNEGVTGAIPTEIGNLSNLQQLNLSNCSLSGSIPSSIGSLSNLGALYLQYNDLSGSIPTEMGNLDKLIYLNLDSNQLSGSIPSSFGDLSSIGDLFLNDNQLSGNLPVELTNLSTISRIHLVNNQLEGTIPGFNNMPNLGDLYIYNNEGIDSISTDFGNNPQMLYLYINGCNIRNLHELQGVPALNQLNIKENKLEFDDIEPNLGKSNSTFVYSPQDTVGTVISDTLCLGSTDTLSVIVGGTNNKYEWFLNDISLSGPDSNPDYIIDEMSVSDTGVYRCQITNDLATNLILYHHPITIRAYPAPNPSITGDTIVCYRDTITYTCNTDADLTYLWELTEGIIIGANDNPQVDVLWNGNGTGTLTITQTNSYGCDSSIICNVTISELPQPVIQNGNEDFEVCLNDTLDYSCNEETNMTYLWEVEQGEIIGNNDEATVQVTWDSEGTGKLRIIQTNENDCVNTLEQDITIYPKPQPDFTGNTSVMIDEIESYSSNSESGTTNIWEIIPSDMGVFQGMETAKDIEIKWAKLGAAQLKLIQTNQDGCTDSIEYDINISEVPLPDPPVLTYPGNNANQIDINDKFTWNSSTGATKYEIQASDVSNFNNKIISEADLTATELNMSNLNEGVKYYWKVRAGNDYGYGNWSTIWDFTTTMPDKSITVINPNGDEKWQIGTNQTIEWNAINIDRVKIEYSTDTGSSWSVIDSSASASDDSYIWTIPETESDNCLVRISDEDDATFDISDNIFSIIPKAETFLSLDAPNGGEKLQVGSNYNIEWSYANLDNIRIDYSVDNGITWENIIEPYPADSTIYLWAIPETPSENCLILISDLGNYTESDTSDNVFAITQNAEAFVKVKKPNGGELWYKNKDYNITWQSGLVDNVKIEYTTDAGSSWSVIDSSVPASDSSYTWTAADTNSDQCKVRITDESNGLLYDESDAFFTIKELPDTNIIVVAPNGGEELTINNIYEINWSSSNVENVKIEFSNNYGANWYKIIDSYSAEAGKYSWKVPDMASNVCLIKIYDVNDTSICDESDAVFSIVKLSELLPPILVLPANGSSNQTTSVNFVWNQSNGAVKYIISISEGSDFSSQVDGSIDQSDNTYQSEKLEKSTTYYWRVKAGNETYYSDWSEVWNFSTEAPANSITLSLPNLEEDLMEYEDRDLQIDVIVEDIDIEDEYKPDSLELIIKFRRNSLYPRVPFIEEDSWRYITLKPQLDEINNGDVLTSFKTVMLLSDTTGTPLIFDSTSCFGEYEANIITKDGSLKLKNLGYIDDDKVRLIKIKEGAVIKSIRPNPADDEIILTINSTESFLANVEIYTSLGNLLFTLPLSLDKGINEEYIKIPGELTNGIYTVVLKSGTQPDSKVFMIIK